MEIVYTRKAMQDLQSIREHYEARSEPSLHNIVADIVHVVEDIPQSLSRGRKTAHPDVWEKVTPKYGYLLPYYVFQETLFILRVYDPRRRGLNYSEIVEIQE
jgi:plasmid stabilization system protein ParE